MVALVHRRWEQQQTARSHSLHGQHGRSFCQPPPPQVSESLARDIFVFSIRPPVKPADFISDLFQTCLVSSCHNFFIFRFLPPPSLGNPSAKGVAQNKEIWQVICDCLIRCGWIRLTCNPARNAKKMDESDEKREKYMHRSSFKVVAQSKNRTITRQAIRPNCCRSTPMMECRGINYPKCTGKPPAEDA